MQNIMSRNKPGLFFVTIFFFGCVIIAACQGKPSTTTAPTAIDQSQFPWSVEVTKSEAVKDLSGSEAAQQYNGDVTQIQFVEKPADGDMFLLVELTVTKQVAGASTFAWKNLSVKDGSGNSYTRMENDTFLQNYNFPRLKSTNLTLGTNKGFICFEIPAEAVKGDLSLVYTSAEMSLEIPLSH